MTHTEPGLIDVHAHFSPPTTPGMRQRILEASHANNFLVPEPYEWSLDATLDFMDETGTALQLLSNIPTGHRLLHASNATTDSRSSPSTPHGSVCWPPCPPTTHRPHSKRPDA